MPVAIDSRRPAAVDGGPLLSGSLGEESPSSCHVSRSVSPPTPHDPPAGFPLQATRRELMRRRKKLDSVLLRWGHVVPVKEALRKVKRDLEMQMKEKEEK